MTAAVTTHAPEHESESVFRPAALLMCGRTLAFAATFYIPVVLARVFDPSQFGTYKQLFLIQSTVFYVGQLGMATSLYYFLPLSPRQAGRYIANSLFILASAGLCGLGLLVLAAPKVSAWMSNPALSAYLPWIGLYILLMMVAAPLEMVLIARHRHLAASASYALSDIARAAGFILPVLLFHTLDSLLKGATAVAAIRVLAMLVCFRREFSGSLWPHGALLKQQLAYALPFGVAVLVEIVQGNLPAYVVAGLTNPATFAIFAVGCLQIPLVDFAASPTSDVMMVRMQERLAQGRDRAVLVIWHDTTWKLALFFFPLAALLMAVAPQTIVLLFTPKYLASVPVFIAWTMLIPLTAFQVDGVLRVFAQTRLILALNLMRLAIIAGLMKWSLGAFQLAGPALVIVLALLAFKVAALVRMKTLLHTTVRQLLPWRRLAILAAAAAGAAFVAVISKPYLALPRFGLIVAASVIFAVVFGALIWSLGLLSAGEIQSIASMLGKARAIVRRNSGLCAESQAS